MQAPCQSTSHISGRGSKATLEKDEGSREQTWRVALDLCRHVARRAMATLRHPSNLGVGGVPCSINRSEASCSDERFSRLRRRPSSAKLPASWQPRMLAQSWSLKTIISWEFLPSATS